MSSTPFDKAEESIWNLIRPRTTIIVSSTPFAEKRA